MSEPTQARRRRIVKGTRSAKPERTPADILSFAWSKKKRADKYAKAYTEASKAAIAVMKEAKTRDQQFTDEDGGNVKVTMIEGVTTVVDYDGVLRDLSPEQRKQVVIETIDMTKLTGLAALDDDVLAIIANHTTENPKAPYLRWNS